MLLLFQWIWVASLGCSTLTVSALVYIHHHHHHHYHYQMVLGQTGQQHQHLVLDTSAQLNVTQVGLSTIQRFVLIRTVSSHSIISLCWTLSQNCALTYLFTYLLYSQATHCLSADSHTWWVKKQDARLIIVHVSAIDHFNCASPSHSTGNL